MTQILRRLHEGYYNYLLLFFILLFLFRPFNEGFSYLIVWKLCFTGAFIASIFNTRHHRFVRTLAIILAIPALICGWLDLFFPQLFVMTVCLVIAFMTVCTASVVYDVVLRAKVTLETLKGVICAYFMVAFVFAYAYYLIEYLSPGSFHLIERDRSFVIHSRDLAEMMYFSFVTLLTIGFGDITPLKNVSQTVVVMEGIIGQFYIAILVARIVSVYAILTNANLHKHDR